MRTALLAAVTAATLGAGSSQDRRAAPPIVVPSIAYVVHVRPSQPEAVDVDMHLANVPRLVRLAMKVHAEYDAKYWRNLEAARVDGTADDAHAGITRVDSTSWSATLPGGRGVVHYRLRVPGTSGLRRAWMPFVRANGALVNPPDFLLYLPDFVGGPASVQLDVPSSWRIATALAPTRTPALYTAPDALTLLDSPILLGDVAGWEFDEPGTRFHVAYWPASARTTFDTAAFVNGIQRVTRAALGIFGGAPARNFWFLLQDSAWDALEHRASVTLGMPGSALAGNPHAGLSELAHETFHAWNLVAIRPAGYNTLRNSAPTPTPSLWWGEGVTLYYADALMRRGGVADSSPSRLEHLRQLLTSYYAAPWNRSVSPEASSLAMNASPITDPNATGSYYLQGELLGYALDALVRDSTHDRRGLDAVMRAMYVTFGAAGSAGYTEAQLQRTIERVCACRARNLFAHEIRTPGLIDLRPALQRLGYDLVVDTAEATDSAGVPLPDRRLRLDFTDTVPPPKLVVRDTASAWYRSGLRTGDALLAVNHSPVSSWSDLRRALQALKVGDTVHVDARRDSVPLDVLVRVSGYRTARVRIVNQRRTTAVQRSRRQLWTNGW